MLDLLDVLSLAVDLATAPRLIGCVAAGLAAGALLHSIGDGSSVMNAAAFTVAGGAALSGLVWELHAATRKETRFAAARRSRHERRASTRTRG